MFHLNLQSTLILKKETKLRKLLKKSFEKYKRKTISIIINIIDQQRYNYFAPKKLLTV
jgi:hypothetical protein